MSNNTVVSNNTADVFELLLTQRLERALANNDYREAHLVDQQLDQHRAEQYPESCVTLKEAIRV